MKAFLSIPFYVIAAFLGLAALVIAVISGLVFGLISGLGLVFAAIGEELSG
jgi:hypothetical protein